MISSLTHLVIIWIIRFLITFNGQTIKYFLKMLDCSSLGEKTTYWFLPHEMNQISPAEMSTFRDYIPVMEINIYVCSHSSVHKSSPILVKFGTKVLHSTWKIRFFNQQNCSTGIYFLQQNLPKLIVSHLCLQSAIFVVILMWGIEQVSEQCLWSFSRRKNNRLSILALRYEGLGWNYFY